MPSLLIIFGCAYSPEICRTVMDITASLLQLCAVRICRTVIDLYSLVFAAARGQGSGVFMGVYARLWVFMRVYEYG